MGITIILLVAALTMLTAEVWIRRKSPQSATVLRIISGLVGLLLGLGAAVLISFLLWDGRQSNQKDTNSWATPQGRSSPSREVIAPVSSGCTALVETAEKSGAIRSGGVTRAGATILVDASWAQMDFAMQTTLAECVSHYMAKSQDRWAKKIQFKNQQTGVVYGTIENTRYRTGE